MRCPYTEYSGYTSGTEAKYAFMELQDVAASIHTHAKGMAEPLSDEDLQGMVEWVKMRLERWDEPTSRYDAAVKELCLAALEERILTIAKP